MDLEEVVQPKRSWVRKAGFGILLLFIIGILSPLILLSFLNLSKEERNLNSGYLSEKLSSFVNSRSEDYQINFEAISLSKGDGFFNPAVHIEDLEIKNAKGGTILRLPSFETRVRQLASLKSNDRAEIVDVSDMELTLWRSEDGSFSFAPEGQSSVGFSDLGGDLDKFILRLSTTGYLTNLKTLKLNNVSVSYGDAITKGSFYFTNGTVTINRDPSAIDVSASFLLADTDKEKDAALVQASLKRQLGAEATELGIDTGKISTVRVADQIPALDWLRAFNAEVSTSLFVEIGPDLSVESLNGVLDAGEGDLRSGPTNSAGKFNSAKSYFTYSIKTDEIKLDQMEVSADLGRLSGSASAQLERNQFGIVTGASANLTIDELNLAKEDIFAKDLAFTDGQFDLGILVSPISLRVKSGEMKFSETNLTMEGELWAREAFWESTISLGVDQFTKADLVNFWPVTLTPKTRKWIDENIHEGNIQDFNGSFLREGGKSDFEFTFAFNEARSTIIKTVPHLRNARGQGYLTKDTFTLDLADGHVIPKSGEAISMAGSVLHIPDIKVRPALGEVQLITKGDLSAHLEVMDAPVFSFLKKINKTPDLADGHAALSGWISTPLKRKVDRDQIVFDIRGVLKDVNSQYLAKGREVRAERLEFRASENAISLMGAANIDAVPTEFSWEQLIADNPEKRSSLIAELSISKSSLEAFDIELPEGSFSGETRAKIDLLLKPGEAPSFELTSDLKGSVLKIDTLGWRKGSKEKGALSIIGRLEEPIEISDVKVSGAGLSAKGEIELTQEGGFKEASFGTVKIDDWFSSSVKIAGQGKKASTELKGKYLDLRNLNLKAAGADAAGSTVIELDRVRITSSLSLHNFKATIKRDGTPTGKFTARVNGGAPISGRIYQTPAGTTIDVRADNAGAVLKSAGLLENINSGEMLVTLAPSKEEGVYTGQFEVDYFRMKHNSGIVDILDGISLVGLIQKMEKGGIQFDNAKGKFELHPNGTKLSRVSLVGPSMGLTLDGWFNANTKTIDFEGVITPIYALNGSVRNLFGKLFGRRKGEGLFSFTYKLKGTTEKPDANVNPLSILTPGMFREIFRQDPPKAPN